MAYTIRQVEPRGLAEALDLVWQVFLAFDAPDFSPEGVAEFKDFIEPGRVAGRLEGGEMRLWGSYQGDALAGVLAAESGHINLLFVAPAHHRQGVARGLLARLLEVCPAPGRLTVNASPYAVEAYRRMGFEASGPRQTKNGISFIPMARTIEKREL